MDYNSSVADSFFGDFVNATLPRELSSPSATEWYLTSPSQPFGLDAKNSYPDYTDISATNFSLRLSQLLNAYYLANIAPAAVAGDLITEDWVNPYPYDFTTVIGTTITAYDFIICHDQWLAVLILASVMMMGCGIACAALGVLHPDTEDMSIDVAVEMRAFEALKKVVEVVDDNS